MTYGTLIASFAVMQAAWQAAARVASRYAAQSQIVLQGALSEFRIILEVCEL